MRLILLFFSLFSLSAAAQDTFSIVAVDPETGEIGSAGATCIDTEDCNGCGGAIVISGLLPGQAAMNAQASVCLPNVNLNAGIEQLSEGASPQETLDFLLENDACVFGDTMNRQYGIVDLDPDGNPRSVAFTGSEALNYAGHLTGDNYAIQGNILLGAQILEDMEAGFLNTEGSLAQKLMAALQGANVPGADSRCLDEGISSKSAFIRVAQPDDDPDDLYLEINIPIAPEGVDPIDTLQSLFDEWQSTISSTQTTDIQSGISVYPNPATSDFTVHIPAHLYRNGLTLRLYDTAGKVIYTRAVNNRFPTVQRSVLSAKGLILAEIKNADNQIIGTEKVILR